MGCHCLLQWSHYFLAKWGTLEVPPDPISGFCSDIIPIYIILSFISSYNFSQLSYFFPHPTYLSPILHLYCCCCLVAKSYPTLWPMDCSTPSFHLPLLIMGSSPSNPLISDTILFYFSACDAMHVCAQLYPILWDPMDCSPLGYSVHGIFPTRILEWVAIFSSRGSSQPREWIHVTFLSRRILYHCTT